MRSSLKILAPLLAASLLVPPVAASGSHRDGVATGESDVYHVEDEQPQFVCPQDIFWVTLVLELDNPSPNAAVSLTVADRLPQSAPADVATASDPTAEVSVQLGGCNREATAVVTGLVAPGGESYTLTTEDGGRLVEAFAGVVGVTE